ncbi:cytochrome b561 [Crenobacter luteus]|uniref:cytochrome b n=1 Tax=Crenobacter luteus TaxID=1452487 RepID=UPI0010470D57|nr:cytochrome b [Crenobacter luteus]TCP14785.1 cytochrome b561 [Crenobacter luteus]
MNDPAERYAAPTVLLHWLMAALIVATFWLGLTVADMPLSPTKFKWIAWHKWLGVTLLGLLALRLLSRALTRAPALPATMGTHARTMARLGHLGLYALMLAVPLSGWLMSSAYGFPVVYLQLFALPDLVAKNEALGDALRDAHTVLNWTLAALVAGHVLAALKHQFVDRDGLMARMRLRRR